MLSRRHIAVAVTLLLAFAFACALAAPRSGVARIPLGDRPLEDLHSDTPRGCAKGPQPGALALESWAARHYIGESWGVFACRHVERTRQWSLHAEGRALDWRLDAAIPRERATADRLIRRLLASDAQGRPFALARCMGIQEIIFNCRIWEPDGLGLSLYKRCRNRPRGRRRKPIHRTIEHLDHVHIGLTWDGARKRTSFWRFGYDRE